MQPTIHFFDGVPLGHPDGCRTLIPAGASAPAFRLPLAFTGQETGSYTVRFLCRGQPVPGVRLEA